LGEGVNVILVVARIYLPDESANVDGCKYNMERAAERIAEEYGGTHVVRYLKMPYIMPEGDDRCDIQKIRRKLEE
jgi:hypothetical protein